jgi:hypothetical protein
MKKMNTTIFSMLLLASVLVIGCKDDEATPSEQQFLTALDGTWTATLIVDGSSDRIEDDYKGGFTITFDSQNKTYQTGGGPDKLPIPPTATFAMGSDAAHDIILDPVGLNLPVSYILTPDKKKMTMAFTYVG